MNPADVAQYLAGAALGLLIVVVVAWAALVSWRTR